jgi:hypothetical protein
MGQKASGETLGSPQSSLELLKKDDQMARKAIKSLPEKRA